MEQRQKDLSEKFLKDTERIASDFVAAFGLKHKKEVENLSDSLFRWMDFRLRYVEPKPRDVALSKRMNRLFPYHVDNSLKHLLKLIQTGADINPYQGKGLIWHHDTSGKNRSNRTDLLWADWGITHLHLTTQPIRAGKYFCTPSDWLLFAIVGADIVACIDIRHHKEPNVFSNPELIQTVYDSWPDYMETFKMRDIGPPTSTYSAEEFKKLRKHGIMGVLTIDGQVYIPPGMGISGASTSSKVSDCMNQVSNYANELARLVITDSQFDGKVDGPNNAYELCLTPRGLAVYAKNIDKAWVLPREKDSGERNFLTILHDTLAPEWALARLLSGEERTSYVPSVNKKNEKP